MKRLPDLAPDSQIPLYQQLKAWLVAGIRAGRWPPDTPLPSERTLARDLNVSRATVRQAIDDLAHTGLVVRRHGRGTFVAVGSGKQPTKRGVIGDIVFGADLTPASTLLSARLEMPSRKVARALDLAPDEMVAVITRLRHIGKKPLLVERSHLAHALAPDLLEQDLTGSLPRLLAERYHLELHSGEELLMVAGARAWVAKALDIKKKHSVLCARRTLRDGKGRAIDFTRRYARIDRCRYRVRLDPAGPADFVIWE